MNAPRILIAGVGNIFFGDDAFGVEVAHRLATRPLPDDVRVADFGIRAYDLSLALLDGYETAIFVDAMPRGGRPGTLYVLEPDGEDDEINASTLEGHALDPVNVLRFAKTMGGALPRVLVVGCEPTSPEEKDLPMEFTPAVAAAIDEAVVLIESLVERLRTGELPSGSETCGAASVERYRATP